MIGGVFSGEGAAIIPLAGVVVALLGLIWQMKRSEHEDIEAAEQREYQSRDVAREEAIDLAEVRGKAINDLHEEVARLRQEVEAERTAHAEAVSRLQRALDLSREQALETQQMLAHGMRGLLIYLLGELERDPPRVDVAIQRLREALADSKTIVPGQRYSI